MNNIKYHSIITYSNSFETFSKVDFNNEKICLAFSLFVAEKHINLCSRGVRIEVIKTIEDNNTISATIVRSLNYFIN